MTYLTMRVGENMLDILRMMEVSAHRRVKSPF